MAQMHQITVPGKTGLEIAKRVMFLAYQAAAVVGAGQFQAVDDATEDEVWERICTCGDRLFANKPRQTNPVFAEYVFGRLMDLRVTLDASSCEISDRPLDVENNTWSRTYPTAADLADAVVASLAEPVKTESEGQRA